MGAHWKWLSHSAAAHAEAFIQTWLEAHPELSITLQTLSTGVPEINHRLNVHLCTLHSPITSKNRRGLGISSFGKKKQCWKTCPEPINIHEMFLLCRWRMREKTIHKRWFTRTALGDVWWFSCPPVGSFLSHWAYGDLIAFIFCH